MDSAVQVTGTRQRQAWQDGVLPPVEKVRDGLWSIPVPIPDNPLRYTLIYAFELPDGVALVDAGWDAEDSWLALVAGLRTAGYEPADVRAVLVTHMHPDHFGLAGRVREASGAWIGMHEADAAQVRPDEGLTDSITRRAASQLTDAGAPRDVVGEPHGLSRAHLLEDGAEVLIADHDRIDVFRCHSRSSLAAGLRPRGARARRASTPDPCTTSDPRRSRSNIGAPLSPRVLRPTGRVTTTGSMSDTDTSALVPGQSTARDNGERIGRSQAEERRCGSVPWRRVTISRLAGC